jgi:tetratricopeptide (TPR) repeat protein
VGSVEPDVWYVCGTVAAAHGDWSTALADWRESLTRSPRRLAAIGRAAAGRVSPDRFRSEALPDDPALWYAVMPQLFPDNSAPGRTDWLRAIDARYTREEPSAVAGYLAWGSALEELRDVSAALKVWRRAVDQFPADVRLRDELSRHLEAEELYSEALPVLEWLIAHQPNNGGYPHRLAAAKHALKLMAEIDRP